MQQKQKLILLFLVVVGMILGISAVANSIFAQLNLSNAQSTKIMSSRSSLVAIPNYTNSVMPSSTSSIFSSSISNSSTQNSSAASSKSEVIIIEQKVEKIESNKPSQISSNQPKQADNVVLQSNIEPKTNVTYTKPNPTIFSNPELEPEVTVTKITPQPIVEIVTEVVVQPKPVKVEPKPLDNTKFFNPNCDYSKALEMLRLVNEYRVSQGVGSLRLSGELNNVSCAHVKWMNATGNFSHTGVDGTDPFQRCEKAGTYCNAENVAFNSTGSLRAMFEQFKSSPGHNTNMLEPEYTEIGVGFENIYVGQVFR